MYYPWFSDEDFNKKIAIKKEIKDNKSDIENNRCLTNEQYAVSNFINPQSPYKSILLYHFVGTGKSISAISIAENFIRVDPEKKILVVTKNNTLIDNFKSDLMNICSRYKTLPPNYKFLTYESIRTRVDFTNKVVIIDEIHNLIGNTGYTKIMDCLKNSKNYRLVLLSATPAYDSIIDLFQLSNVLNNVDVPFDNSHTKVSNDTAMLYSGDIHTLTKAGEEYLMKNLHGKVSYLTQDSSSSPEVLYMGTNEYELGLPVILCKMEGHQEEKYSFNIKTVVKNYRIEGTPEMMSSIIYPDIPDLGGMSLGDTGFEYYIGNKKDTSILKFENIKNYSTKLYNMILNLKDCKGKVYIHAHNITSEGVPLITECLSTNGFNKILVVTSKTVGITSKIERFNSPENDDGQIYKILISSDIVAEGVTLLNVRHVHIYQSAWNYSTIDQIVGRAVRKNSHSRLSKEERNVKVYLYASIPNDPNLSVDLSKYKLSTIKDKSIKSFERLIAQDSFTCSAFKTRNTKKGIEGSRECNYSSCEYKCNYEDNSVEIDDSTYDIYLHNKEEYSKISEKIKDIFKTTNYISLTDITKRIPGVSSETIKSILKNNPPIPVNIYGSVYSLDNLKIINKRAVLASEKMVINYYINNGVNTLNKFVSKDNVYVKEPLEYSIGPTLSIEFVKGGKSNKKECKNFDKETLSKAVDNLGINLVKKTKEMMCDAILNHFKDF